MGADHIHSILIGADDRRETRKITDCFHVNLPAVDAETALVELSRDEVLCLLLATPGGGKFRKLREKGHFVVESGIDGIKDAGLKRLIH